MMDDKKKKAIIESVLFSIGDSVSVSKIAELIDDSVKNTKKLISEMVQALDEAESGLTIIELDDSYQMCSRPEMYEYLIDITSNAHKNTLSDSALETLSIIAYKQPVTRLDVERIRGVNSDYAINRLLEFDLIRELGRLDAPGKPILFGTTEQFLRSFGVRSLEELPQISATLMEEFKEQAEAEVQLKLDI